MKVGSWITVCLCLGIYQQVSAGGNSSLKYRKAEVNRSNGSETVQGADSSNASASAHARGGGSGILEFSLKSRYQKLTNPGDA